MVLQVVVFSTPRRSIQEKKLPNSVQYRTNVVGTYYIDKIGISLDVPLGNTATGVVALLLFAIGNIGRVQEQDTLRLSWL